MAEATLFSVKLTWTDPKKPGPDCPYDNTEAPTPFGPYLITWKSWKDYPSYSVDFQSEFVTAANTLDAAKEAAQSDFSKRLESVSLRASAPPEGVRAQTIEECAKVLDECAQDWNRIRDPGMANNARAYAKKIRALALSPAAAGGEAFTAYDAWDDLVEKTDRTSPEEYPDMCLITFNELQDYITRALSAQSARVKSLEELIKQSLQALELAHSILHDCPAREIIFKALLSSSDQIQSTTETPRALRYPDAISPEPPENAQ